MLVIPAFRVLALLLLLGTLIDACVQTDYYGNWVLVLWDYESSLPSGYFTLLKIIVSGTAAWDACAYSRYTRTGFPGGNVWAILLAIVALAFQPVFPLHFEYEVWAWIDLATFCILTLHAYVVTLPLVRVTLVGRLLGANAQFVSPAMAEAATAQGYISASMLFAKLPENRMPPKLMAPKPEIHPPTIAPEPTPIDNMAMEYAALVKSVGRDADQILTRTSPPPVGSDRQRWIEDTLRLAEFAILDQTRTLAQRAIARRIIIMLSTWKLSASPAYSVTEIGEATVAREPLRFSGQPSLKEAAPEFIRSASAALGDPTKTLAQRATALRMLAMFASWNPQPWAPSTPSPAPPTPKSPIEKT